MSSRSTNAIDGHPRNLKRSESLPMSSPTSLQTPTMDQSSPPSPPLFPSWRTASSSLTSASGHVRKFGINDDASDGYYSAMETFGSSRSLASHRLSSDTWHSTNDLQDFVGANADADDDSRRSLDTSADSINSLNTRNNNQSSIDIDIDDCTGFCSATSRSKPTLKPNSNSPSSSQSSAMRSSSSSSLSSSSSSFQFVFETIEDHETMMVIGSNDSNGSNRTTIVTAPSKVAPRGHIPGFGMDAPCPEQRRRRTVTDEIAETIQAPNVKKPRRRRKDSTSMPIPTSIEVLDFEYDPNRLEQLIEILQAATSNKSLPLDGMPLDLRRRIQEFRFAQLQRRRKFMTMPYGIAGMYTNLSDIRMDLRWAEDTSWRRERNLPYVRWADYEEARLNGVVRPYFSYGVLLLNVAMMLYAFHLNDWVVEPLDVNLLIGPSTDALIAAGALQSSLLIENGELYRLAFAVFLHGGVIHLVANMCALWLIGRAVERNHGTVTTCVIYMASALGANLLSVIMQPGYILVGASGAIFGLVGMCLADIVLNWRLLFVVFRQRSGHTWSIAACSIIWILFDLAFNSILGWTPYIDNFAHLGGLLYGFLMACTFLRRLPLKFFGKRSGVLHKIQIKLLRLFGALLVLVMMLVSVFLLMRSDGLTSPCWNCRFISCAPFPFWEEQKWWTCDGCDSISAQTIRDEANEYYQQVDLTCPQGNVELIDVRSLNILEKANLAKALPGLCQQHCFS